jgi:hypothetical protein
MLSARTQALAKLGVQLLGVVIILSAMPSGFALASASTAVSASGNYSVATGPYTVSVHGSDFELECLCVVPGIAFTYVAPPAQGCYAGGSPNPQVTSTNPSWAEYLVDGSIINGNVGVFMFNNWYFDDVTATYYVIWHC